jgi:hypothetical protein
VEPKTPLRTRPLAPILAQLRGHFQVKSGCVATRAFVFNIIYMYTCARIHAIHTYTPTHLHTYIHTCIHTYLPTYIHACMRANTETDTNTYTYTYTYRCTYTHIHTPSPIPTPSCIHTYIPTCTYHNKWQEPCGTETPALPCSAIIVQQFRSRQNEFGSNRRRELS